jgi:hypothetical protein
MVATKLDSIRSLVVTLRREVAEALVDYRHTSKRLAEILERGAAIRCSIGEYVVLQFKKEGVSTNFTSEAKDLIERSGAQFVVSVEVDSWSHTDLSRWPHPHRKTAKRGSFAQVWEKEVGGLLPWSEQIDLRELDVTIRRRG